MTRAVAALFAILGIALLGGGLLFAGAVVAVILQGGAEMSSIFITVVLFGLAYLAFREAWRRWRSVAEA